MSQVPGFMTFKVIKPLESSEIKRIEKKSLAGVIGLYPIDPRRHLGYIPDIAINFDISSSGEKRLKPYIWVQLMHYTEKGLAPVPDTYGAPGRCMVPSNHIQTGTWYNASKKIVSDLVLAHPTISVSGTHQDSPFKTWLQSFYGSLASKVNQDAMAALGIPERIVDMVGNGKKRATLVNEILNGMTFCGTLDLFSNKLPSFEEIWSKLGHIDQDRTKNPGKFRKSTGSYFYLIIYRAKTDKGWEYGGSILFEVLDNMYNFIPMEERISRSSPFV
ncbi:Uncharacterized protein LW93_502 [Fusarium fujikuroi]|nr:Uncharacterized protein LW93_502 [Fusarium fujikuroi]